ncbi:MAG TPA: hypothetical protein VFK40_04990 [Nitrososphaeraceae archaeon]|nr:hypothetical protein [Nitrososphaeraceae archaeon]
MTFKDLQKLTTIQQNNITKSSEFDIFQNLPFWIWDQSEHKNQDKLTKCCFNHVLGLTKIDLTLNIGIFT